MKSVIFIHASLFLLGSVLGLFVQYESAVDASFGDSVVEFPLGIAMAALMVGTTSLVRRTHPLANVFWFYYLCAIFFLGIALGMTGQYLFKGADWQSPLRLLSSCLGYLVGLAGLAKLHRVRHGRDIWDTAKPDVEAKNLSEDVKSE